jgi:nitrogenase molybdenum-iron protein alpha/beta subunit
MEGDYLQGVINACIEGAANLIDLHVQARDNCVNIVAEKNIALNADANFMEIAHLLDRMGLRVNCRFVRRTSVEQLRRFLRASLNLPAYMDHFGRVLRDFLSESFGCVFTQNPFPSGFWESKRWIREIATHTNRTQQADSLLEQIREEYLDAIHTLQPHLAGKRLMLVTYNHDVDWILETAFDLDMTVVKVGIVNYSQDGQYRTRYADRVMADIGYNPDRRSEDIEALRPDLCLGNYQSPGLPEITHYDTIPPCPNVGPLGGLALAQRWARLLSSPIKEGWRRDEKRLLHKHAQDPPARRVTP